MSKKPEALKNCATMADQDAVISQAIQENDGLFLGGFAEATKTLVKDWTVAHNKDDLTGKAYGFSLLHNPTGARFFARVDSYTGRIKVSVSVPRFQFSTYSIEQIVSGKMDYVAPPTFAFDRFNTDPHRVGKEAGKKIGLFGFAAWQFVKEKQDQEAQMNGQKQAAADFLTKNGWLVKELNKQTYATKKGCQELTIDEFGAVRFYSQFIRASAEKMAKAAEILGE